MYNLKAYAKRNNKIVETYSTTDPAEIYERLTHTMIAKYINKCKWVRTITRENLFNGYQKITVYQTENRKDIYIIKER